MTLETTTFHDLVIINPAVFNDERGYFFEAYNKEKFSALGITIDFVQDNQSFSKKGTLRGLHYQNPPHAQTKLVRVLQGEIIDVAVDLRQDSPTFGKWFGIELTPENKLQLYVPRGFGHGFSVLSETAVFAYKCDNFYSPTLERGILYNDVDLAVDWKVPADKAVISEKDTKHPLFKNAELNF